MCIRDSRSTIDKKGKAIIKTLKTSTIHQGVISIDEPIIPNEYEYFTLGTVESSADVRANIQEIDLAVYPNPVRSELFINLEKIKGKKGSLKIYNLFGQLIAEQAYDPSTNILRFDTHDYINGIYELKIRIDHQEATRKFTVQRLY